MLLIVVVRNRAVNKMDKTPPSKGNHFVNIWIKCVPDDIFVIHMYVYTILQNRSLFRLFCYLFAIFST